MPKFIKKPVVIEAEQWFPGKVVDGVRNPVPGELPRHHVMTAHNQIVFLEPGDWIIPEPDGRGFYPCKPDILESTYDWAESPSEPGLVIDAILEHYGFPFASKGVEKLHGRVAYTIVMGKDMLLDLSFMPRIEVPK